MRSASRGEMRREEEPAERLKRLSRGNAKLGLGWGCREKPVFRNVWVRRVSMTKDLTMSSASLLVSVKH